MLICDTHADTLYAMQKHAPALDVTPEVLAHGPDIRVQALALFVGAQGLTGSDLDLIDRELLAFETLKTQGLCQIRTLDQARAGQANALLTIEGGEAFGSDLSSVERFARLGVRIAALVWNNENLLAHPAVGGSREGLTPYGRQVVSELRRYRIAPDISHLNEAGADELMDSDLPPMASHSCAKKLCNHPRNLTDRQLKALFRQGGFVGVNFYPRFLTGTEQASINDVIDHMDYMCCLGGEDCVGLGSDFDGIDVYPSGLRTTADIPALLERMTARGFSPALVEAIAGQNFARYLKRIDEDTARP